MESGFHKEKFRVYIIDVFHTNIFSRGMLDNILNYAMRYENSSKDQLCQFLLEMIPEVEFGEVAAFCEDFILTENGRRTKDEWIEKNRKTVKDYL